jgi:endonuclease YncB( thermonuclease family)
MIYSIAPLYNYRAKPVRIVDGDTYDMIIDQGLGDRCKRRIRLMAEHGPVDCPEMSTLDGKTAMQFAVEALPIGQWVHIFTQPDMRQVTDKADSFGRYLARVRTTSIFDLGNTMLQLGLAKLWKP